MEGAQGQKSGLTHLTPHEEPRKSGAVSVYGILSAKDRFRILRFWLVTTLSWISQRGPSGPTRTVRRSLRQREDQQQVGGGCGGMRRESYHNTGHPGSITAWINYKTKSKFRRNYLPTTAICIETVQFKKKTYFLNDRSRAIFQAFPLFLFLVIHMVSTLRA